MEIYLFILGAAVFVVGIYMYGTYPYVTKRMGLEISFAEFCGLCIHHKGC